jgi:hypothetical protein
LPHPSAKIAIDTAPIAVGCCVKATPREESRANSASRSSTSSDTPQVLFEIVGQAGEITVERQGLRADYERGLDAYRRGDWQAARGHFSDCLTRFRSDGPARTMLDRIESLAAMPARAGSSTAPWRLGKDDLA